MSAQATVTAEDKKFNYNKRKSSLSGQEAENSYFSAKPADGRKLRNKLTNRDINTTADGGHTSQESILEMLKEPTNSKKQQKLKRPISESSRQPDSQRS